MHILQYVSTTLAVREELRLSPSDCIDRRGDINDTIQSFAILYRGTRGGYGTYGGT